jgi:hypothetical protein
VRVTVFTFVGWRISYRIAACVVGSLFISGCASSESNVQPPPPGEGPGVPRVVEVHEELSISTVHFPPGRYWLHAEDDTGYYYRGGKQVRKNGFAGPQQYDGGIFVQKGSRPSVRGYIIWAGGRTKIGNLAPDEYDFRQ